MADPITRRTVLKTAAATAAISTLPIAPEQASALGHAEGHWTGAAAIVECLKSEGVDCVYGIPGAQENELWDEFKARNLGYLLVTHEFSAACMADGYARSTGKPGVICVVPGPGITNCLTGLGEALLDSVPIVAIVGDVARGEKYRPFQVHALPNVDLLKPVTKGVFAAVQAGDIPGMIRQAFALAQSGEPGPVAVVVPYNLLIEKIHVAITPPIQQPLSYDESAVAKALELLRSTRLLGHPLRVGIYAGQGCMAASRELTEVAELLQAPVATSVSGKGVIDECHPLAVGWGYGGQGTRTAEHAFAHRDLVLAIGVKFSEVSTAFYSLPQHRHLIHVDASAANLGQVMKADICVQADAGLFLRHLLANADCIRRAPDPHLIGSIRQWKTVDSRENQSVPHHHSRGTPNRPCCGVDPMAFLLALRKQTPPDALTFVDVTVSEHWAAEVFTTTRPRTYFNPTDNQAMGWSIPAAIGAQRVHPGRLCSTITGDGCFLMSALETTTAAREGLPVKFFVLDDRSYHYMQELQKSAYRRTTATFLAHLDYASLAKAYGLNFLKIDCTSNLEDSIRAAIEYPGPVLVQVVADYGTRPVRWIAAARKRYISELSADQKIRFLARVGARSICMGQGDD